MATVFIYSLSPCRPRPGVRTGTPISHYSTRTWLEGAPCLPMCCTSWIYFAKWRKIWMWNVGVRCLLPPTRLVPWVPTKNTSWLQYTGTSKECLNHFFFVSLASFSLYFRIQYINFYFAPLLYFLFLFFAQVRGRQPPPAPRRHNRRLMPNKEV